LLPSGPIGTKEARARPLGFRFANWVVGMAFRIFARWEVEGRENVPPEGPLLVIANHTHYLDPPLVNTCLSRRVMFLAKRELITETTGWRHWCLLHYGLIPMRRGGLDREALKRASEFLAAGGALGLFPEGTRSRSGVLQRAQGGASMVALPNQVPIVPMGISGLAGVKIKPGTLFKRPRVRVRIGEPFHLPYGTTPTRGTLVEASDYMMERIAALLPEEQRGYYGSHKALEQAAPERREGD